MKTSITSPRVLGCLAVAIATLLPSCVDPYTHSQGPAVTSYRAGYEVRTLPSGYRTEIVDGSSYYVHNGTYYRPRSGRYVVVEAPRRARYHRQPAHQEVVITRLPRGYRTINHRGVRYYQVNDVYYQQRGSGYIVVRRPF
jgi:hypothetical protein